LLGGRSTVLVILLTLLVIFFYLRNPRPGRFLVNAMVLGLFAAMAIAFAVILRALRLYALRGGDVGVILSPSDLAIGNFGAVFVNDFNQFDWFAIMLDIVPARIPFQYGETFLEFFAMFVPRALWAGKPLPIGFVISMALGGPRAGKPSTILGELYLNFHVPGIMVGMVIFGILARAVYAYLQDNWGNPAAILLYAYTFASLHQFFTRTFAPRMFGFVLFIIPTILALRYVQRRKA
jgi:oligosaccharide repeat unit polymerase